MKRCLILTLLIFLSLYNIPLFAQTEDTGLLTIDRIYNSREFAQERFGPARWLEDGRGYTTLERSDGSGGRDIVLYNPDTGKREILVSAKLLIPQGKSIPLSINDYTWSPDGKILLIFTNSRRVWRRNTRGDYWVLNLESKKLKQLGGDAKPSTMMFATFSPDGLKVGYVCENNIYAQDLENEKIKQLTNDGSKTIINGTFDWVYEEEFGLRNGIRWSPDSRFIAFWQLDAEGVGVFYMINNTDSVYSKIIPVQYPKVGTTNSACRMAVVNVTDGKITWFKVPGDLRNNYIARMDWAGNSEKIILQRLNRLQNTNKVMLGDIKTGEVKTVFIDKDDAWVSVNNDLRWMDNGKYFTWVSERDGWRHVYMVSRDGKEVKLITPGEFDIVNILNIDEKSGWLYYMASPDNPTRRYLFRSKLNGKGEPEQLTPNDQKGTHRYTVSQNAKWAFHSYTALNIPNTIDLVKLPGHKSVRVLAGNETFKKKMKTIKPSPSEFFRVNIGNNVELDCWMMRPYNFDPSKKYPVLFNVYGEPGGQTVLDRWQGLWHRMLTQKGYVIMSVDNRGTPAPRGRDWRKSVYGQIGILASDDQAAALKAIIKKYSFVDSGRIGIWGWSGGGSMSLNMIFRYPDLYHTAMSVAPVGNQLFYDTIYQERYMGLPEGNADGYKNGSPVTFAHQLKGNLLIVHGTGDDNVHYQNAETVINKLIRHNKKFTMMAYPNRSHGIYEGQGTTRHLYGLLTDYLMENLPPGPVDR